MALKSSKSTAVTPTVRIPLQILAIGSAQMCIKETDLFSHTSRMTETVKAGGGAQAKMETILVCRMPDSDAWYFREEANATCLSRL